MGWFRLSLNVATAFRNAPLHEELYALLSERFSEKGKIIQGFKKKKRYMDWNNFLANDMDAWKRAHSQ